MDCIVKCYAIQKQTATELRNIGGTCAISALKIYNAVNKEYQRTRENICSYPLVLL